MKRALLVLGMVALAISCASAQTVLYKSQATLQWNAPTTTMDGSPFLPTDVLTYEVYIYDYTAGVVDPQNVALLTFIAETAATEQLIVFPYRSVWAAGVRAKLVDAGGAVSYSAVAWSYLEVDADAVAGPFCYSPQGLPRNPQSLRDSGM